MKSGTMTEEIPATREGLSEYIKLLEKAFGPVSSEYHRMEKALTEARRRLEKIRS